MYKQLPLFPEPILKYGDPVETWRGKGLAGYRHEPTGKYAIYTFTPFGIVSGRWDWYTIEQIKKVYHKDALSDWVRAGLI